jgi:hypothetical protein
MMKVVSWSICTTSQLTIASVNAIPSLHAIRFPSLPVAIIAI